ncbi:MAG: MBL fold metallo-hydrolase [Pseudomonadales bacterium]|jgi:phosphoribosyl 1,2-cyclic phosphodiesterase|nr:MBL fold metallo-hydrolase [Pseudomonadales bacterium]
MGVRFASLGSGSKGNGTLIDDGNTCLLIDLGFTIKEAVRRLGRLDVSPADIDAILVTHEHADHIHGVAGFARKFSTPVYLTPGTYEAKTMGQLPELRKINCHSTFTVGSFEVTPVAVPHDAKEPCQYVLCSQGVSVGVLTDLGHITPHVQRSYQGCDALLLECNHDPVMLEQGPYPYPLKRRVGGDYGHLNNAQAAELLDVLDLVRLRHLVISHISEQNNQPDLAREAVKPQLSGWQGSLVLANQSEGFDWISLG